MQKNLLNNICFNALFISIYMVLVFVFGDLSFGFMNGFISIRIAEIVLPLCCFDKKYLPGAIISCFVCNLFSGQFVDLIVGTLQTSITVLILYYIKIKHLAIFLGSLICGIMIGLEIYFLGFSIIGYWIILTIFIGEFIILELGYLLFKKHNFFV